MHIQVEARVVYPAPNQPATGQPGAAPPSNLKSVGPSRAESPSTLVLGPPSSTEAKQFSTDKKHTRKSNTGLFGKIKGFFGKVFH
jgi:hypothetical protein